MFGAFRGLIDQGCSVEQSLDITVSLQSLFDLTASNFVIMLLYFYTDIKNIMYNDWSQFCNEFVSFLLCLVGLVSM